MSSQRVTSHGFWRHSKDFLAAADAVKPPRVKAQDVVRSKPSLVAYFLLGRSIELSLKSFLFAKGYSVTELRNTKRFGHDLDKLVTECRRRKLGREVKLSDIEMRAIRLLNDAYRGKTLEYLEYGVYHLPNYFYLQGIAKKLVDGLARYSMNPPTNKSLQRRDRKKAIGAP